MGAAPVLETERLRLRPHRADDFDALFAMWSNPDVTRFIGPPSSESRTWTNLTLIAGQWALLGLGYWVVEERESGAFMGECGFLDLRRPLGNRMRDVPEAGWIFAPHAHGRGYAGEAMRAALAWADTTYAAQRTVCLINSANAASIRLAQRCGYSAFEDVTYLDTPVTLFERLRP